MLWPAYHCGVLRSVYAGSLEASQNSSPSPSPINKFWLLSPMAPQQKKDRGFPHSSSPAVSQSPVAATPLPTRASSSSRSVGRGEDKSQKGDPESSSKSAAQRDSLSQHQPMRESQGSRTEVSTQEGSPESLRGWRQTPFQKREVPSESTDIVKERDTSDSLEMAVQKSDSPNRPGDPDLPRDPLSTGSGQQQQKASGSGGFPAYPILGVSLGSDVVGDAYTKVGPCEGTRRSQQTVWTPELGETRETLANLTAMQEPRRKEAPLMIPRLIHRPSPKKCLPGAMFFLQLNSIAELLDFCCLKAQRGEG